MIAYLSWLALASTLGVGTGAWMTRHREPFGTWAVLGAAMGPLVVPYARAHLQTRAEIDLRPEDPDVDLTDGALVADEELRQNAASATSAG